MRTASPLDLFKQNPTTWIVVAATVLALLAGLMGGLLGHWFTRASATATGSCNATDVALGVLPGVVTVSIRNDEASGVGSGVIVRPDGHIITNNHVISAAATAGTIDVVFSDGRSVEAKLVGRDPKSDLAV